MQYDSHPFSSLRNFPLCHFWKTSKVQRFVLFDVWTFHLRKKIRKFSLKCKKIMYFLKHFYILQMVKMKMIMQCEQKLTNLKSGNIWRPSVHLLYNMFGVKSPMEYTKVSIIFMCWNSFVTPCLNNSTTVDWHYSRADTKRRADTIRAYMTFFFKRTIFLFSIVLQRLTVHRVMDQYGQKGTKKAWRCRVKSCKLVFFKNYIVHMNCRPSNNSSLKIASISWIQSTTITEVA